MTHDKPDAPAFLEALTDKNIQLQGEMAPGVFVFGQVRPMGRIRAYTSAGLSPFAGRGAPSEFYLLGHVHMDAEGKVARVEGFNGPEGERWAKAAHQKLVASGVMAEKATVQPSTPLRACSYTGIR